MKRLLVLAGIVLALITTVDRVHATRIVHCMGPIIVSN